MKKYTAIIVEDERLPLLSLIQKLNEYHPDIEIADTCDDAETSLEKILKIKPDLLFLDIQLPNKNSLWLIAQLSAALKSMPYIIFTTAFKSADYLLQAIKFQAIDYLLKPVNIVDLAKAITKMKELANNRNITDPNTKYSFHTYNSTLIISASEIVYCEADGNYCKMFTDKYTEEAIFERLNNIEAKLLSTKLFIRAGKKHLVNKKSIYRLNLRRQSCHLKTSINNFYEVKLSAGGFAALKIEFEK
ncbi:MAG: response regulator transcription factor [Prevotellaceae bacterium]|jgi:DNA-binding LytR/AlgR family response regulator|nr:response regulator transcription factor [Prevotellaceae bacterium]